MQLIFILFCNLISRGILVGRGGVFKTKTTPLPSFYFNEALSKKAKVNKFLWQKTTGTHGRVHRLFPKRECMHESI